MEVKLLSLRSHGSTVIGEFADYYGKTRNMRVGDRIEIQQRGVDTEPSRSELGLADTAQNRRDLPDQYARPVDIVVNEHEAAEFAKLVLQWTASGSFLLQNGHLANLWREEKRRRHE